MEVQLEPGRLAQFDVVADGEVIAARARVGLVKRLLGGGWPDPADVVEALRTRQQAAS